MSTAIQTSETSADARTAQGRMRYITPVRGGWMVRVERRDSRLVELIMLQDVFGGDILRAVTPGSVRSAETETSHEYRLTVTELYRAQFVAAAVAALNNGLVAQ